MARYLAFLVALIITSGLFVGGNKAYADIVKGIVAVGERGCKKSDLIIISTNMGFVAAEVYTGFFDKGDEVVGNLNSYGLFDVSTNGSSGSIYIDDYMLSRSSAVEKCFGN
jgi:hypothetical protein